MGAINRMMNNNFDPVQVERALDVMDVELADANAKMKGIDKNSDQINAIQQIKQKHLDEMKIDVRDLRSDVEVEQKNVTATRAEDAALRQEVQASPIYQIKEFISETVTPCLKHTCYVITGVALGSAIGGVLTFATNRNAEVGAAIGAMVGGVFVVVAIGVNKLCRKHFQCCSNNPAIS